MKALCLGDVSAFCSALMLLTWAISLKSYKDGEQHCEGLPMPLTSFHQLINQYLLSTYHMQGAVSIRQTKHVQDAVWPYSQWLVGV